MKILQVGSSLLQGGGIAKHLVHLTHGLQELGHEVHLTAPVNSWLWDFAQRENIPVHNLKVLNQHDLRSLPAYRRLMRSERFDIVHTHFSRDYLVPALASRMEGRGANIITRHMPHCWPHIRRWMYGFKLYERIIGVSQAVSNAMVQGGIPPNRVITVYNGVEQMNTTAIPNLREELNIPLQSVLIGIVSRVNHQKGQRFLLEALPFVEENAILLIVGDGPDIPLLQRMAKKKNLQQRVRFLGWRKDSDSILEALDVVTQPSLWEEACSLAILEAMPHARPLVVTNSGGNAELVEHGISGLVVEKNDVPALANALNQLIRSPELRRQMGQAGLQRYKNQFTVQHMARKVERVYNDVCCTQAV